MIGQEEFGTIVGGDMECWLGRWVAAALGGRVGWGGIEWHICTEKKKKPSALLASRMQ